jgi:predicted nucleic acid-binding protein
MSDAETPQFVDTNILVYAHDHSAGAKHAQARALIEQLWESRSGCVSIQVLHEFYITVTQKVARPLESEHATQIVTDIATWRVHTPGVQGVLNAIRLRERHGLPFWDAMIIASAIQLGCRTLWSEDLQPGQTYADVTIENPFS